MARMTLTEASRIFEEETLEIRARQARKDAAADVLKAWFRRTGKQTYRGRIGYAKLARRQLDTVAVKAELGDRLPEFEKVVDYEQLSLLK